MSGKSLFDILTACGKSHPYGMPESRETDGRVPSGSVSVKIRDRLFLVRNANDIFLYDGEEGKEIRLADCPADNSLDGFRREMSFAPDVILQAEFGDGMLKTGGEGFEITVSKAGEKLLLIGLKETGDLIVFDVSRFLLYACLNGRFILGYMEV